MKQTFFFLLISIFLSSCDKSEDDLTTLSSDNDRTDILTRYAKLNFIENYKDVALYNELIMLPLWDSLNIVKQNADSLILCFPISTEIAVNQNLFLFVTESHQTVRFCIVGIPYEYSESKANNKLESRGAINGGTLPEVTIIGDLCAQMSHICSDPYDPFFLEFLWSRYPEVMGGTGGGSASASPLGDGYPWDDLNEEEKKFAKEHPLAAKKIYDNAQEASKKTSNEVGQHNGKGDAMRHAYWSALNAKSEGETFAKQFGDVHEMTIGQPAGEKAMDLFNNAAGYKIGVEASRNNWSNDRIYQEVQKAANDGRLQLNIK